MLEFQFEFHWNLLLRVQSIISQHWFRLWPGAEQATSHFLRIRGNYGHLRLNPRISTGTTALSHLHRHYKCNKSFQWGSKYAHGLVVMNKINDRIAHQTPRVHHCLHMRNSNSDLDYLSIFRSKHSQLPDAQCHVNMACNQWLETWDVAIIYTGGNKDLCHCSMDVSWLHDNVPSKIKFDLNCHCQLTCDDWGIPNTKLKYCQCTSAALLCCRNTQLFNCIWQIITHVWWLGIVLCIPSRYKTSLSS